MWLTWAFDVGKGRRPRPGQPAGDHHAGEQPEQERAPIDR
jgi:hypothetical protein